MTLDEIEGVLGEALELLPPRFGPDDQPRAKIAAIEAHMMACAYVNATLVRARHWLRAIRQALDDDWQALQGWEVAIEGNKPRGRLTAADVNRAKARIAPAAYEAGRKARRLAESVDDQIVRLEREEKAISRAYSMISGT